MFMCMAAQPANTMNHRALQIQQRNDKYECECEYECTRVQVQNMNTKHYFETLLTPAHATPAPSLVLLVTELLTMASVTLSFASGWNLTLVESPLNKASSSRA